MVTWCVGIKRIKKRVEPRDRRTGGVKETWKKIVESDLNRTNLSATDALDCKKWRIFIRGGKGHSDDRSGDNG